MPSLMALLLLLPASSRTLGQKGDEIRDYIQIDDVRLRAPWNNDMVIISMALDTFGSILKVYATIWSVWTKQSSLQ